MEFLMSIQALSLILLLVGIGLAFSHVHLSGWILGWILLSGALLLQGFRSMLSYFADHGGLDATTYALANDWMGLGFSLLIVASMHMMREVLARHKLAAESLRMVSAAANDAIIIMGKTGMVAVWNQAAERIFGYSEQEAQGKKLGELIVPERYRTEFEDMFNHLGSGGRESVSSAPRDLAGLRKDGTQIVTEFSISSVTISGKWHAIYIVRDITARKQAEDEIRERTGALEMLSAKMLSGDEMEKKKLAFGLHEGLAQTLITIKMRIEYKLAQFAASKAHDESLASIIPLLQSVIKDVQAIATGLRPSSLDELGLLPTIDWFCREFERLHPAIGVEEEISVHEKDVPAPLKIVIYRIIESAFTNIARYESTDRIALALQLEHGVITLAIDDTSQDSRYAATTERDTDSDPHARFGEAQADRRRARRAERRDSDLQARFGEAKERTTLSGGSFTIARSKAGGVTLRASWAA
jgi:PAS domain S-box-containing protein